MKKIFVLLLFCGILSLYLVACGSSGSTSSADAQTGNAVHLTATQFAQSSITIHKGEQLMLIDDSVVPHTIANGMWKNGAAQTIQETGAPQIENVQVADNGTASIGPFNTDGTFHLYCTIHEGMNLTVVVQ